MLGDVIVNTDYLYLVWDGNSLLSACDYQVCRAYIRSRHYCGWLLEFPHPSSKIPAIWKYNSLKLVSFHRLSERSHALRGIEWHADGMDKSCSSVAAELQEMRSDARDDRMLVFSGRFHLGKGESVKFCYPVRVVTAGDFILPGPSVEAMYAPSLRANGAPSRIKASRPIL